jgi:proteasome-associated ATPase
MAMSEQETILFNKAKDKIVEQQGLLKQLTAPAYHMGIVLEVYDKSVVIETGGQVFELDRPEGSPVLTVGQGVDIHPQTGQVVKGSKFVSYGASGNVSQIDDGGKTIMVSLPQGIVTVEHSVIPVAVGDTVVLNATNHIILKKIQKESKYAFKTQSVLSWDDIGACEDAKREMIAALETPYVKKDIFSFFHKKQIKGALLWGRAGNGKTLIGRAAAGSLARMHGKESASSGFIYIKGPEILDKFVGETEGQIREAFVHGARHYKEQGYPAIIFVDEADAILMRRGSRTTAGMEMTIVPQFLSCMDGIEDSGVFVLLATNRADTLDPAVIRPGRIDRKIYVAPPTKENAPSIWTIHMRDIPVAKGSSTEQLIQTTNDALFGEQYPLYIIASEGSKKTFGLGQLVSGALIAGIVERASAIAIDRNNDPANMDGLSQDDFSAALSAMQKEQFGMNHFDELREFIDNNKLEPTSIEQCHDGQKIMDKPKERQTQVQVVAIPGGPKGGKYDA